MAESVSELLPLMPVKPIVLWISKGRVVVDQTGFCPALGL
jgi:hypothetical protein